MPRVSETQLTAENVRRLFIERYPEFPTWLDGQTWELDVETEIHEGNANRFQSALHYQARVLGLSLSSKTVYRDGKRKLLIRAY